MRARGCVRSSLSRTDAPPNTVEVVVRSMSPANAILEYAAEHGIDFIVMGTHGRSLVAHLLLGSVTETVVRSAACPVLTVRATDGRCDGGEGAEPARRAAEERPGDAASPQTNRCLNGVRHDVERQTRDRLER